MTRQVVDGRQRSIRIGPSPAAILQGAAPERWSSAPALFSSFSRRSRIQ